MQTRQYKLILLLFTLILGFFLPEVEAESIIAADAFLLTGFVESGFEWDGPQDSTKKDTSKIRKPYKPSPYPTFKPKDRYGDPFANPQERSALFGGDPGNITRKVEFDTLTNSYVIYEKIGNLDFRPVSTMTFEEYAKYKQREQLKEAVKKQAENQGGGGALQSGRLIPKIYLNPAFDRIFGGNAVDIRPNGSIVLDFGGQTQQSYNPALPIRQQRFSQFLFDQQISLALQGKVGEKLKININYDTKASFEFENNIKLAYDGMDHEILQKIEAGNVSLPVSSSLITGAQNLFGVKTTMKFGNTKVVSVASIQRGRADKVSIKGGAQTKDINIRADAYEANRHFFLSQFFRNNYERALTNPAIVPPPSGVVINRVEVYLTNLANNTQTLRNMVAFLDLGEGRAFKQQYQIGGRDSLSPSTNNANTLYGRVKNERKVRESDTTRAALAAAPFFLSNGIDYEVIRGARKLTDREFTFHRELGYISLNTPLRDIEVLAVAFEYTFNGQVYKVGELVEDYQNLGPNDAVILKMLRPSDMNIHLRYPTWKLEMRNIYSLGSSQVSKDGFQLKVIYKDDSSGVDNPALKQGRRVANKQLVEVLNADKLNPAGELQPDGVWDFVPGNLIDANAGRIIFPVLEPFGSHLRRQFDFPGELNYINLYVFNELYSNVQQLAQQAANKNKYYLIGKVQSSSSSEIQLPGFNIAPGSVRVSAGIRQLTEGTDFSVDYNTGRVRILDQGVLTSGEEVSISYEKADLFQFQQRSFFGTRIDHVVNQDINFGGTLLYLNERPLIRRTQVGEEPTSNVLMGFDLNYKKDSRTLTKLLDLLPFYQTKEVSNITFGGEFARLIPGTNSFVDPSKRGLSYIDDFEGVRTPTDLYRTPISWKLGSLPTEMTTLYKSENPDDENGNEPISIYNRRARLSWYSIDNIFYRTSTGGIKPPNVTTADIEFAYVRPVGPQEVYPNRDLQAVNLNEITMDVAYYPEERGPYNFATSVLPSGKLRNPANNWGSMQRAIFRDNNFDAANVEYLEFWMMDPFISGEFGRVGENTDGSLRKGKMFIHLGSVSEDIVKDGKHSFENGLPTANQRASVDTVSWGVVSTQQYLNNAFDNNPSSRPQQDVGLDGINDDKEREFFNSDTRPGAFNLFRKIRENTPDIQPDAISKLSADPASDNFTHYLSSDLNNNDNTSLTKILDRYKAFSGVEGNSPTNTGGTFTPSSTQEPDNEDLNRDRVVSDQERYFSYRVDVDPRNFQVGRNYIVDQLNTDKGAWYLFRVPIRDLNHPNFAGKVGGIDNFNTIRFIRLMYTGFEVPVVFRFVQMQLVASTWRPYTSLLRPQGQNCVITDDEDDAAMTVGTVNIEENGAATANKVPYVVPPGSFRDRDVTSGVNRRINEQSLSLCIDRLRRNSAKAVFKNVRYDFLNYRRLKMYISAHTFDESGRTKSGDVTAFLRLGTDFNENYYEVAVPLDLTPVGTTNDREIWPQQNEIDVAFDQLYAAKSQRNLNGIPLNEPYTIFNIGGTKMSVTVVGNPDMNACNTLMLGVRHTNCDDYQPKTLCVWFNDLRVTDFDKNSGSAATGRLSVKLADLGNLTATGKFVGIGFGGIEQRISERARTNTYSYNVASSITLDKFLPKRLGIRLPMYVSYDRQAIDPNPFREDGRDGFDPLNPDIRLRASLAGIQDENRRNQYKRMVVDQTTRRSINFTNVSKVKTGKSPKSFPWDIENLNFTYAYSEAERTSINVASYLNRNTKYGVGYNWSSSGGIIEPFKKVKFMDNVVLKPIKELNFAILPTMIQARADLDRNYTRNIQRSSNVFGRNLDPTFEKQFFMNRTYGLRYAPFKSLQLDYSSNVSAIIDEPFGDLNTQAKRDSVNNNIKKGGRIKNFNQNIRATWRLPIDKIPLTDWISADVSYNAGYVWMATAQGFQDSLGNKISNSRDQTINSRIDLLKLYNKLPFLQKINSPTPPVPKNPALPDTGKKPRELKALKGILRLMMSMRQINVSYTVQEATSLPGFRPAPGFLGQNPFTQAPGWDFILGQQNLGINTRAAENGWLARSKYQNQQFSRSLTENLTARTSLEPLPDLRINLDAKVSNSANYSELFRDTNGLYSPNPAFVSLNPNRTGSYNISMISIRTAFNGNDAENRSPEFNNFESYRYTIRARLEEQNRFRGEGNRRVRYDNNSQDVLLPAFLAAYTGSDPNKQSFNPFPIIPLPNWRLDYGGLSKLKSVQKYFSTVTLTHGYNSTYTVQSYTTNLAYGADNVNLDKRVYNYQFASKATTTPNGDSIFTSIFPIGQVVLNERFSPLIGVNIRTKSKITLKFDHNRDRNIILSLNNAQITETRNRDYTFGIGFQKSGIKLPFRVDGRTVILSNELTTRLDITIRESLTVQRQFEQINTITQGLTNLQVRPTMNYMVNQRLSVQAYVEHTVDTPKVSTSFKRRSTRFGVQFRFNLM